MMIKFKMIMGNLKKVRKAQALKRLNNKIRKTSQTLQHLRHLKRKQQQKRKVIYRKIRMMSCKMKRFNRRRVKLIKSKSQ